MKLSNLGEYVKTLLPSSVKPVIVGELSSYQEEGVAIRILSGYDSTEFFGMKSSLYQPLVQIMYRFKTYPKGATMSQDTLDALKGYSDGNIQSILPVGSIMYLGQTEQKLHEFQLTFKTIIKE